jgi:hypothetical protein
MSTQFRALTLNCLPSLFKREPHGGYAVHLHLNLCMAFLVVLLCLLSPLPVAARSSSLAPGSAPAAWGCSGVYHTVQPGESIYSIARMYGSTAYRIAVCNGLSSYRVYVGQTLLVPITYRSSGDTAETPAVVRTFAEVTTARAPATPAPPSVR